MTIIIDHSPTDAMQELLWHVGTVPHNGTHFVRIHYLLELVRQISPGRYDFRDLWFAIDTLRASGG
eukprot:gene8142-1390_t